MSDLLSDIFAHSKAIATIGVYALVSFGVAGLLTSVVPESYHMAILVGWILSGLIVGKLIKSHFVSPQPA